MSFAQYNSGVPMETGSSVDPLKVGMIFLGVLSSVIASIILVCLIWKVIEVLVEKYRRKSIPYGQMEPPDGEGQAEVRGGHLHLPKKVVEMLKKMLSGSAATIRRHNEASTENEGREQLCATANDDDIKVVIIM